MPLIKMYFRSILTGSKKITTFGVINGKFSNEPREWKVWGGEAYGNQGSKRNTTDRQFVTNFRQLTFSGDGKHPGCTVWQNG